jgi:hypothetical protein
MGLHEAIAGSNPLFRRGAQALRSARRLVGASGLARARTRA